MRCEHGTDELLNRNINYLVIHYTEWSSSRKGTAREVAEFFSMHALWVAADFAVDDVEFVAYNPDFKNRYCHTVGDGTVRRGPAGGSLLGIATDQNCINIEMCSSNVTGIMQLPNDPSYFLTEATRSNALMLARYLMNELDIDINHVIRHFDASGKPCPGIIGWNEITGDESEWKRFKEDLAKQAFVPFELGQCVSPRQREDINLKEWDDPLVQALIDMDRGFTGRGNSDIQD